MSEFAVGMKVDVATRQLAAKLAEAGIECAGFDARLLIEAATGASRESLVLDPARALSGDEALRLEEAARRRIAREPVTRILGEREFYGRSFLVTPETLDPRPDTETLVELALELVREEGWNDRDIDILDIGTGTGCILLTLLAELPHARGVGRDVSSDALAVASRNAARLGSVSMRWELARSMNGVRGPYDLVVSNPPYIPSADISGLDPEVREHDPRVALDGGADGLDVIREIVDWSVGEPNTWFVIEFGAGQADAVVALIAARCGDHVARAVRLRKDLGGHTRCVAWKPRS